ncbi:MAG: efflux transporter periplasmic adaptor subunit [Acetobacteraceae bacterium SCN 69-10]|nr:efflux RND transporter periplasmic adaptor subunit [Rhodospirillales bacterium]ODU54216.1 MAG: efflux transporter periplasmic adaptor subunit [Acetobacteraceae bacterium SCN 69-10]OJY76261.1 MAG: efflux transporter periplasmic adaptor subunit [Rhodospirillales bacterium 70-18]
MTTSPQPTRSTSRRLLLGTGLVALAAAAGTAAKLNVLWPATTSAVAAVPPAPPPVPVSIATVTQREVTLWDEFSGRLEAVDRVDIRPRVAGAIQAVHFREGALVKRGDLLFTIDPAPYAAEVARAQAQLEAAKAQAAITRRDAARSQALVGSGAISRRETDSRAGAFAEAEANQRAAEAALETTRLNLGYTQVRAPITGRVGRIEITPGNLVTAGTGAPVLTSLVSVDPIYASFDADEATVSRILANLPAGRDARLELARVPVRLGTTEQAGTPIEGHLQLIDNTVSASSGTVRVRAVFANPDGALMPGQFARIRLGRPGATPALLVSERAVGTDQDKKFVMVVGPGNQATYREVALGQLVDGLRVVKAGLKPGDRIVVNGLQRIRPGVVVAAAD